MRLYKEENGYYALQAAETIIVIDDLHSIFHEAGVSILSDTDYFISDSENNYNILIEYKNGVIEKAVQKNSFNPNQDKYINKVARKFYDTMLYLNHMGFKKPFKYVYILEYPNDDAAIRKSIRNKIVSLLPFKLQSKSNMEFDMISDFEVLSIDEWNTNYPDYPFVRIKQ